MNLDRLCGMERFCFYIPTDSQLSGGAALSSSKTATAPVKLKIAFDDGTSMDVTVEVPVAKAGHIASASVEDPKPKPAR